MSFARIRQITALSVLCWALSALLASKDVRTFILAPSANGSASGAHRKFIWQDAKGVLREVHGLIGTMGIYELHCGVGSRRRWRGIIPVVESRVEWKVFWNPQLSGIASPPPMSDATTHWLVFDALCSHPQTAVNPNNFVVTRTSAMRQVFDHSALYTPIQVMLAIAGFLGFCIVLDVRRFAMKIEKARAQGICPTCEYPFVNDTCPECGFGVTVKK